MYVHYQELYGHCPVAGCSFEVERVILFNPPRVQAYPAVVASAVAIPEVVYISTLQLLALNCSAGCIVSPKLRFRA